MAGLEWWWTVTLRLGKEFGATLQLVSFSVFAAVLDFQAFLIRVSPISSQSLSSRQQSPKLLASIHPVAHLIQYHSTSPVAMTPRLPGLTVYKSHAGRRSSENAKLVECFTWVPFFSSSSTPPSSLLPPPSFL